MKKRIIILGCAITVIVCIGCILGFNIARSKRAVSIDSDNDNESVDNTTVSTESNDLRDDIKAALGNLSYDGESSNSGEDETFNTISDVFEEDESNNTEQGVHEASSDSEYSDTDESEEDESVDEELDEDVGNESENYKEIAEGDEDEDEDEDDDEDEVTAEEIEEFLANNEDFRKAYEEEKSKLEAMDEEETVSFGTDVMSVLPLDQLGSVYTYGFKTENVTADQEPYYSILQSVNAGEYFWIVAGKEEGTVHLCYLSQDEEVVYYGLVE